MNRGEPVVHDVDLVDARVMDEMARVDWHKLEEKDSARFGLALGIYRDAVHVADERRVAWGTCAGGVLTIFVLSVITVATGSSALFLAFLLVLHQAVRALWLWNKWRQADKYARAAEDELVTVAEELGRAHPLT